MRVQSVVVCLVAIITGAQVSQAAVVTVDPDDFASGTAIGGNYAYVTLTSIGTVVDNANVYAYADPTFASTGSNVFAFQQGGSLNPRWVSNGSMLRIDFDYATDFVSIDIIGNDPPGSIPPTDQNRMDAYNAADVLIATAVSAPLLIYEVENISISRPSADIAYVVVGDDPLGDNVHLDNFAYNNLIPEPSTMVLLCLGCMGCWRRRRRQG